MKNQKRYVKKGRKLVDYESLRNITVKCKEAILLAKKAYLTRLGNSLDDPNISKKYWSILKQFLNKRKVPKIPPIYNQDDSIVADVSEKANIFNNFFASQCDLLNTASVLPPEHFLTDHRLNFADLDEIKLLKLIRRLNVSKAHRWDDISIRMIKICDNSLINLL